jgi:transcriptional regulator with XRE-family HTH domain
MTIMPAEVKAARVLLGWSQRELAKRAVVSRSVISGFEIRKARPRPATIRHLQNILESAGVIFVEENGEGPGVRLKKTK